ncbi:MAG: Gfo/Idh/MocA family oxidoreductase [Armatimonadota bacterium]
MTITDTQLTAAIIGARRGSGPGRVFHSHPGCELVGVADRNPEVLQDAGERFGIEPARRYADIDPLLDDDGIEAVFVATPMSLHAQHSIAALRAGKHVMCEVPPVNTIEEGKQLVAAVRESGKKYFFAENCCYFPYLQTYREIVQRHELGEIIYAEGEYIHNCEHLMVDRPDGMSEGNLTWRARMAPIKYCTHDLGPLLQMFSDRCTTAVGMHTGNRRRPDLGVIDMEIGIFQTEKNITIKQLVGFSVAKEPAHHWFTIYGTQGQLEKSRHRQVEGKTRSYLYREGAYRHLREPVILDIPDHHPGAPPEATAGGHGTSEYYMVDAFLRCIAEDTEPEINVYEALDWGLPGICAHISAENGGEPVEVPDPREW